jgi:DNA polymerase III epsilon subunit-like protein
LVAHNASVDVGVLQRKLTGWECPEVFDTLKLARRLEPGQDSYRLGNLVETFKLAEGLPKDLSPHRVTYDVLVAARLFVTLATKAATLEELRGESPGGGEDEAPARRTRHRRALHRSCATTSTMLGRYSFLLPADLVGGLRPLRDPNTVDADEEDELSA